VLRFAPGSLRARLLLGVMLGMILLLLGSGAAIYALQRKALYERFDQAIATTAKALAAQIKYDRNKGVHLDDKVIFPEFDRPSGPDYFQVWRSDGAVAARSRTLGEANLPRPSAAPKPVRYDCELPRDRTGRAILLAIEVPQKGPPERRDPPQTVFLVVARDRHSLVEDLGTLAWILAGTSLGGAALAGVLAVAVVSHGLRPLDRMARQIAELDPSALDRRVDPAGLPTEMRPVAHRLNELLERLQDAFVRERGFTADVAHEFRNPLAAIRSIGEVALASDQPAADTRRDIAEIVGICTQLQAMVEKLLFLARLDSGQIQAGRSPIRVGELAHQMIEPRRAAARDSDVRIVDDCPPDLVVHADADLLRLVLANLIDNAFTYVVPGGQIRIHARRDAGQVAIELSNTAAGLDRRSLDRMFDRFWRADASRAATGMRAGLGLSLVRRAVLVMDGSVEAVADDSTFCVRVRLPS